MENENKALTQNFFNDNFKKAVYELILEGMKNDPDCASTRCYRMGVQTNQMWSAVGSVCQWTIFRGVKISLR